MEPKTLDYTSTPPGKRYTVGTLTYTIGGLVILFCWLLWGDFAWSMRERSVGPVVQLLLKKFSATDTLMSFLYVSIPQIIGLIIGPIISYKSDRHRGKWGRRIPYLLIPTPFAVLAMFGMAFSPELGRLFQSITHYSPGDPNKSVLVTLGFSWIIFEIAATVANAVFGAFVNDVVPHKLLGRFYGMFRAVSLIAGILFNTFYFGQAGQYFKWLFVIIGLVYGVGFTLMCLFVKEGQYPKPRENDGQPMSPLLATGTYLKDCFSKPYYYWVFAAIILPNLAFLPMNTFNLYFSESIGMDGDTYGKRMSIYFFMSLICTIPLGWLADVVHPLRVAMVALLLHAAFSLFGGVIVHDSSTFTVAFIGTGFLSGAWFTATAALQMLLFPKLKFAQFASACGILSAIATMLFAPMIGKMLDRSHAPWTVTAITATPHAATTTPTSAPASAPAKSAGNVDHNYRLAYMAGFILDILGLFATFVVYHKFKALGGPKNYIPPEATPIGSTGPPGFEMETPPND